MKPHNSMAKLAPARVPLDPEAHAQASLIVENGHALVDHILKKVTPVAPNLAYIMKPFMDDLGDPNARRVNQLNDLSLLLDTAHRGADLMNEKPDPDTGRRQISCGNGFPNGYAMTCLTEQESQQVAEVLNDFRPLIKPALQQVNYAIGLTETADMGRRWNLDMGTPEQAHSHTQSKVMHHILAAHPNPNAGDSRHVRVEVDGKPVLTATNLSVGQTGKPTQTFRNV